MSDFSGPALPRDPSLFATDNRVYFSKENAKYMAEDEQGVEFEYDDRASRWFSVADDALAKQQAEAYKVAGVDEAEPTHAGKKRKNADAADDKKDSKKGVKKAKASAPRKNSAVYVTGIPPDTDVEEVSSVFSKCGMIAEEIDTGKPRIKLYEDDKGNFKGDALIIYFRPESVALAVQMLDDTDLRFGETGTSGKMKVQAADFSYKSQKEVPTTNNNPDRKKIIKKTQKLNNKLADWDDDDPSALPDTSSKWDKVVILKYMFTLDELKANPAALLDITDDIRQDCSKLGEVTNVVLYDQEEDGVVSVRFKIEEAAQACVQKMNGRFFAERQIQAYIADGRERFKKNKEGNSAGGDGQESSRLDKFEDWLDGGEKQS
ncbi:MAG: hypothetical protein M1814_004174 [Vezdaea aestivalis]|nr:MAG: hypothetical protein M1814_004174 [Vezdaea aestivalis]